MDDPELDALVAELADVQSSPIASASLSADATKTAPLAAIAVNARLAVDVLALVASRRRLQLVHSRDGRRVRTMAAALQAVRDFLQEVGDAATVAAVADGLDVDALTARDLGRAVEDASRKEVGMAALIRHDAASRGGGRAAVRTGDDALFVELGVAVETVDESEWLYLPAYAVRAARCAYEWALRRGVFVVRRAHGTEQVGNIRAFMRIHALSGSTSYVVRADDVWYALQSLCGLELGTETVPVRSHTHTRVMAVNGCLVAHSHVRTCTAALTGLLLGSIQQHTTQSVLAAVSAGGGITQDKSCVSASASGSASIADRLHEHQRCLAARLHVRDAGDDAMTLGSVLRERILPRALQSALRHPGLDVCVEGGHMRAAVCTAALMRACMHELRSTGHVTAELCKARGVTLDALVDACEPSSRAALLRIRRHALVDTRHVWTLLQQAIDDVVFHDSVVCLTRTLHGLLPALGDIDTRAVEQLFLRPLHIGPPLSSWAPRAVSGSGGCFHVLSSTGGDRSVPADVFMLSCTTLDRLWRSSWRAVSVRAATTLRTLCESVSAVAAEYVRLRADFEDADGGAEELPPPRLNFTPFRLDAEATLTSTVREVLEGDVVLGRLLDGWDAGTERELYDALSSRISSELHARCEDAAAAFHAAAKCFQRHLTSVRNASDAASAAAKEIALKARISQLQSVPEDADMSTRILWLREQLSLPVASASDVQYTPVEKILPGASLIKAGLAVERAYSCCKWSIDASMRGIETVVRRITAGSPESGISARTILESWLRHGLCFRAASLVLISVALKQRAVLPTNVLRDAAAVARFAEQAMTVDASATWPSSVLGAYVSALCEAVADESGAAASGTRASTVHNTDLLAALDAMNAAITPAAPLTDLLQACEALRQAAGAHLSVFNRKEEKEMLTAQQGQLRTVARSLLERSTRNCAAAFTLWDGGAATRGSSSQNADVSDELLLWTGSPHDAMLMVFVTSVWRIGEGKHLVPAPLTLAPEYGGIMERELASAALGAWRTVRAGVAAVDNGGPASLAESGVEWLRHLQRAVMPDSTDIASSPDLVTTVMGELGVVRAHDLHALTPSLGEAIGLLLTESAALRELQHTLE